jgi:tetratricopeptide (TPR) repeat protein
MTPRERRPVAKDSPKGSNGANSLAALYETGVRHLGAERYLDAQICCQQALAIDPDHANSLHLMGLLSFRQGLFDLAVEWMARAIRQNPDPEYLSNLGTVLKHQGRHEEALQAFDKAIQLRPEAPGAWKNLGDALVELGRPADALLSFQHVLKLDPRHRDAACSLGRALNDLKRPEEALAQSGR